MRFESRERGTGRLVVVMMAVIIAVPSVGCRHRRSMLRPSFTNPEPVLITPSQSSTKVIPLDPGTETVLEGVESYGVPEEYLVPEGRTIESESGLPDPVMPAPSEEPELRLEPNSLDSGGDPQSSQVSPPSVERLRGEYGPTTRSRPSTGGSRPRLTGLQGRVQAITDDPIDLVQPPKVERPWQFVVLHHSANPSGGYAQLDRDHREQGGLDGCGYHFVIGNGTGSPDGLIEVTRRWSDQRPGAHCRDAGSANVNEYGIGICLVGNLNDQPPTTKQVESARVLVAYLRQRYQIPTQQIGTHAALTSRPTVCPGSRFPTEEILGDAALARLR